VVAYESLKTSREEWQLVIHKSGRGRLRELLIAEFLFHWDFLMPVVTRASHLEEWSQGELRL